MRPCSYLLLAMLLTLPVRHACAQASEEFHEPRIHVIVSDRIQEIMQQLNGLMSARGRTGLELMELRVEYLGELVSTVDELVTAADELNDAIPGIPMSPENKITFQALAAKLQQEASSLKQEAQDANFGGVEPAYQRLSSTCDACHQLFRF